MRATCPICKTSYDLSTLAAKGADAVIICAVCQTHLTIKAPSWKSLWKPIVSIRQNTNDLIEE